MKILRIFKACKSHVWLRFEALSLNKVFGSRISDAFNSGSKPVLSFVTNETSV